MSHALVFRFSSWLLRRGLSSGAAARMPIQVGDLAVGARDGGYIYIDKVATGVHVLSRFIVY